MTFAPSSPIPFAAPRLEPEPTSPGRAHASSSALSVESATIDVTELVAFAARLDAHAARGGESVSAGSVVAKAFLVASLRHPGVDARWPLLPARHGVRLSELTAALEDASTASPIPDDAAVLSVGAIAEHPDDVHTVDIRLAFDPRHTDAVEAHRLVEELTSLLADPWELIAHC